VATSQRIAILTPLEPEKTGIAPYCAALLASLGGLVNITAVTPDSVAALCPPIAGVEIIGLSSYLAQRDAFALAVYHMGNHTLFHDWIYEELLDRPGLVVLHDMDLSGFSRGHPANSANHLSIDDVVGSRASVIGPRLSTLASVIEASAGVLLHSSRYLESLQRRHPATQFFTVPLAGIRSGAPSERVTRRTALGWDEHFIFAVFGAISAFKRIELVLHSFATVVRHHPSARLLIAGWQFEPDTAEGLQRLARELDINAVVEFTLDLPATEFAAYNEMVDCLIDLRAEHDGAVSSTIMNSLAAGLPVISTEQVVLADLPVEYVTTVSNEVTAAIPEAAARMRALLESRGEVLAAREDRAGHFARSSASLAAVATGHANAIVTTLATLAENPARFTPARLPQWKQGGRVTVIGDLAAATGLMEFGRSLTRTLVESGVGVDHTHYESYRANHILASEINGLLHRLPQQRHADTELWLSNLNEFPTISDTLLRPSGTNRRVIASWFWELPIVAEPFRSHLARVDEIWTGSPFIARTIETFTDVPVVVIPFPLALSVADGIERRDFGIPEDRVVFFFDYDADSTEARKNPLGLISAFEKAFRGRPSEQSPCLVIKVRNGGAEHNRPLILRLREQLARHGGVLIEEELSRPEMNALLTCTDIYSSLHRAEGVGLGMLEAMWLGKPVISPAYPAKWLFSLAEAGSAIRAPLKEITNADYESGAVNNHVYSEGLPWTEPDRADAAEWMRALADDSQLRESLGRRQAQLVREHYSPRRAAEIMLARLAIPAPQRRVTLSSN
jgi:glycosyltransferase involved in cell wall biosynthesis